MKDGGTVNDFLDKTLGTSVKYDCMEMVFQKVHTNVLREGRGMVET